MRRPRPLLLPLLALAAACSTQAAPAAQAPRLDLANRPAVDGITRTTIRDDARVTVTRVHFAPGAAEPVHTHPFELMIVPVRDGAVTWVVGDRTTSRLEAGAVQFAPANVPHQLANTGGEPFRDHRRGPEVSGPSGERTRGPAPRLEPAPSRFPVRLPAHRSGEAAPAGSEARNSARWWRHIAACTWFRCPREPGPGGSMT